MGLLTLAGVVSQCSLFRTRKGQNIIASASASFGVIGAIVGAYFGVSSANRAAEIVRQTPLDVTRPEPFQGPSGS